mmetsp:Transcript_2105/g.6270  ORF Transcript_2105/g.6270 Transcript_2105/m.6270 type:complete len:344 (+) Transcript_2105:226-1257(+)
MSCSDALSRIADVRGATSRPRAASVDGPDDARTRSLFDSLPDCLLVDVLEYGGPRPAVCERFRTCGLLVAALDLGCCAARCSDGELGAVVALQGRVTKLRLHHGIRITDPGVAAAARALGARLVDLDVTSTFGVTDATLKVVAAACPALRRLVFSGCGKCSDRGLRSIAGGAAAASGALECVEFESFNYSWDFVTDRGLRALGTVKSLRAVDMSGNNGVTVRGVKALAACPLERLACRSCERCDDSWLEALGGIATLRHVDVRKNHLVTEAGRAALSAAVAVLYDVDVADGWGDDAATVRGFEDRVFGALSREERVFGGQYGGVGIGEGEMALYRPDKAGHYK